MEDPMTTFLTRELQEGLEAARKLAAKKRSRLKVEMDGQSWPVLRMWQGGFALDADTAPHLRGLVDIYDGARHMMQALVVASEEEPGEVRFEFKRATRAEDRAAIDYARDENAPVGLTGYL